MRSILIAVLGLGLIAGGALAQDKSAAAPAPAATAVTPVLLKGKITKMEGSMLTVTAADGTSTSVRLAADFKIYVLKKIKMSAIKPGSFIATTNVPVADGVGESTEFRVFAPEMKGLGEGNYPMADGTQNMMTNATVTTRVASTPKGREMDVAYSGKGGTGTRHIVVPKKVVIRSMSMADFDALKVGIAMEGRAVAAKDGSLVLHRILIGEHGKPPVT